MHHDERALDSGVGLVERMRPVDAQPLRGWTDRNPADALRRRRTAWLYLRAGRYAQRERDQQ
jgi:hypothetical protein